MAMVCNAEKTLIVNVFKTKVDLRLLQAMRAETLKKKPLNAEVRRILNILYYQRPYLTGECTLAQ